MSKKAKSQKSKSSKTKSEQRTASEEQRPEISVPDPALTSPKSDRVIRAIAVTTEILEAAKAYKRATKISFYQLGYETIRERLVKEGFLSAETGKAIPQEAVIAKS